MNLCKSSSKIPLVKGPILIRLKEIVHPIVLRDFAISSDNDLI